MNHHRHRLLDADGRGPQLRDVARSWRRSSRTAIGWWSISGLDHNQAEAGDDGASGDHTRGTSSWLTGVYPKRTEGADVRNGISADQIAAGVLGKDTRAAVARAGHRPELPGRPVREQLQLRLSEHAGVDARRPRRCRPRTTRAWCSSACSATAARASSAPTQIRRQPEHHRLGARRVRPFAAAARPGRPRQGGGVRGRRARGRAPHRDASRRGRTTELPTLDRPRGIPERFDEHVKLMYELQWLAFRADMTRVVTFMLGRELNFRTYPEIGVTEGHHGLVASRRPSRADREVREARRLSGRALLVVPREAAGHAGGRRHAARPLAVPLRRRPEQPEYARAQRPAAGGRGRRSARSTAAGTRRAESARR